MVPKTALSLVLMMVPKKVPLTAHSKGPKMALKKELSRDEEWDSHSVSSKLMVPMTVSS